MSEREPPALATWIIERLGSSCYRESLLGDLIEEYRHGRSQSWYWRQVFAAVVIARLQLVRSLLSIPIKVVLWVLIECAIVTLGAATLAWATGANKIPDKTHTCPCAQHR